MITGQIAVALLETEDKAIDFTSIGKRGNDVTDVLEARQAATELKTVLVGQSVNHGGRNDSSDSNLLSEVLTASSAGLADIVEQQKDRKSRAPRL